MKHFVTQGIVLSLGAVAALASGCSNSSSGFIGTGGTGGTSSSSTAGSTTTGNGRDNTMGSGGGSTTGTGGSASCASCIVVATLPVGSAPWGIAVDATNVYWTNSGTGEVMQARTDGTAQVTLTMGETMPEALEVAGGFVYWGSYMPTGVIRKAPIGGGTVTDIVSAPWTRELALVGTTSVVRTSEPDDLYEAPLTGLGDAGTPTLLTNNPLSYGIAVDATSIYWVNRGDGYIKKADLDLTNDTPLANGDTPWGITVDATSIYWTEGGSEPNVGRVMKASKVDGTGGVIIADGQATPQGIAVDATSVYWANMDGGTINKAPLAGGTVTVLAHGQQSPLKIAVDATSVYWTNSGGDTVMKTAK